MVRAYLTSEERARILGLHEGGMLIRDIMTCTGRSKNCILTLLRLSSELPPGELPVIRKKAWQKTSGLFENMEACKA